MSKVKNKRKRQHARQQAQQERTLPNIPDNKENETQNHRGAADDGDYQRANKKEQPMRLCERLTRGYVTNWLLVIFTAALAATAVYQFLILRGQLDVMRKDQRAWINIPPPKTEPLITDDLHIRWITLINTGKTPARHIAGNLFVEIIPNGGEPHFRGEFPHTTFTVGSILPNYPIPAPITRTRFGIGSNEQMEEYPITPEEKRELEQGEAWLTEHGMIEYMDIFKVQHWVKFCFWHNFKVGAGYSARSCSNYNDVDEN
jgi:hypothetical protein